MFNFLITQAISFLNELLGEIDASFHFPKKALEQRQGSLNVSLQRATETGVTTVAYARRIWEETLVEINPQRPGKDGFWFLGRKILYIEPESLSKI